MNINLEDILTLANSDNLVVIEEMNDIIKITSAAGDILLVDDDIPKLYSRLTHRLFKRIPGNVICPECTTIPGIIHENDISGDKHKSYICMWCNKSITNFITINDINKI